jgi:hypothetical protein
VWSFKLTESVQVDTVPRSRTGQQRVCASVAKRLLCCFASLNGITQQIWHFTGPGIVFPWISLSHWKLFQMKVVNINDVLFQVLYSFSVWWVLIVNSDCFPKQHQPIDRCHGDVLCFLCGTDWILKYYLDELRLQRVKSAPKTLNTKPNWPQSWYGCCGKMKNSPLPGIKLLC